MFIGENKELIISLLLLGFLYQKNEFSDKKVHRWNLTEKFSEISWDLKEKPLSNTIYLWEVICYP